MKITKRVARYIEEHGFKISAIAKLAGISYQTLYASLGKNGKRDLRVDEYLLVCSALGLDPNYFDISK